MTNKNVAAKFSYSMLPHTPLKLAGLTTCLYIDNWSDSACHVLKEFPLAVCMFIGAISLAYLNVTLF